MIPRTSNKCDKWIERRKEKLDKQHEERDFSGYSNYEKKKLRPIKGLYRQLAARYLKKDLNNLYEKLNVGHYWSFMRIPDSKKEDKTFLIAMHFIGYKGPLLCPLEDLPLHIGDTGSGDQIIAWRFKIGG